MTETQLKYLHWHCNSIWFDLIQFDSVLFDIIEMVFNTFSYKEEERNHNHYLQHISISLIDTNITQYCDTD